MSLAIRLMNFPLAVAFFACNETSTQTQEWEDATLVTAALQIGNPSWDVQESLHVGVTRWHAVDVGQRHVYPLWASGNQWHPVALHLRLQSQDESPVRFVVLSPLQEGTRSVIGSAGYDAPVSNAELNVNLTLAGQYLIVVGSYELAQWSPYQLSAHCTGPNGCDARVDALARPKTGALIGSEIASGQLISTRLNPKLSTLGSFEVELWHSAPGLHWNATLLAVSSSSGNQANFLLPKNTVKPGDDLLFKVRSGDQMPIADSGVWARYAPTRRSFARLDSILYGDLGGMTISGVTGYFEGIDEMSLRRTEDNVEIVQATAQATLPGQTSNGFATFDVTFAPELFGPDGELNPNLPHNGDILQLGRNLANETFQSLGCFEFCNDLAGTGQCIAQTVSCP